MDSWRLLFLCSRAWRPRRWADVTVMDTDPRVLGATDPEKLLRGRIVATIMGGKLVYEAPQADAGAKRGGPR